MNTFGRTQGLHNVKKARTSTQLKSYNKKKVSAADARKRMAHCKISDILEQRKWDEFHGINYG